MLKLAKENPGAVHGVEHDEIISLQSGTGQVQIVPQAKMDVRW